MIFPQPGHFTFPPTHSSLTRQRLRQWGHSMAIDILGSRRRQGALHQEHSGIGGAGEEG